MEINQILRKINDLEIAIMELGGEIEIIKTQIYDHAKRIEGLNKK